MSEEDYEVRKRLGEYGQRSGRLVAELVIDGTGWNMTIYAYSPSDLRYRTRVCTLQKDDVDELSTFLKEILVRSKDLRGVMPANRLSDKEIFIRGIIARYMIRRAEVCLIIPLPRA